MLSDGLSVPGVTFTYTLSPVEAVEGTSDTHAIYAGPDGAVFLSSDDVSVSGNKAYMRFSPADTKLPENGAQSGDAIAFATPDILTDEVYAAKTLSIDLTGVTFTKIGIYRYIVTEEACPYNGIVSDPVSERYVDVYVFKNDQDAFLPGAVIVRTDSGTADAEGNVNPDVKSAGFTNRLTTHSLTLSKTVSGNQASYRQYFRFTVTLTGTESQGDGETRIPVTGTYDPRPADNMATSYDADDMRQANETQLHSDNGTLYLTVAQLRDGKDFYLHSGQSVTLSGIPEGMGYEITEAQEDYTPSVTVTGDEAAASQNQVTDDALNADAAAVFLNERSGMLPTTGISAEIALPAIVMSCALAAVVVIRRKRR